MADVNVYDNIGLQDSASASIPILLVYPYDSIGVTDYELVNGIHYVNVYDSIALTDGISRTVTSLLLDIVINDFVGGSAYVGFGQQFPVSKSYEWKTDVVGYDSGREQRNQIFSQPIRHWPINWQAMDEASRNRFIELFHRSRGMTRTFLFRDWDDYRANGIEIETNGVATEYQLIKEYYPSEIESWTEDKKDIAPTSVFAPIVIHNVNGVQTRTLLNPPAAANQFFLDDRTGVMIWRAASPPSSGILNVTFEFYFRVRFADDRHTDLMWTQDYWRSDGVELVEVIT
jgi:uncharacterized protein (TIGR02217 family)